MDASPCHLPWQHVRVMLKDRHKNDWRHLPLAVLQLFSKRFLVGRRLGVVDIQLQTFHDRPTEMTLELVPVKSYAMILGLKISWYHIRQKCEKIFRRNKLLSLEAKVGKVGCLLDFEF